MPKKLKPTKAKAVPVLTAGRPTLYRSEYITQLLDYFGQKPYREVLVQGVATDKPNDFPTFSGFAAKLGVHRGTLGTWRGQFPEFDQAYLRAKDMQEHFLITNGLKGLFACGFAVFTAKNVLGWRDKSEQEITIDSESRNGQIAVDEFVKVFNAFKHERKG